MDDFLERLYRLTQATRRVPREDFLSLCLGRQLERDKPLAAFLVERVLQQSEVVGTWRPPPGWEGRVEAQAQVTAWVPGESRAVRADLVLSLLGPTVAHVVIEAKVGDSEPDEAQLEGYRRALPGALVVSLVEERRRDRCRPSAPVLSWDDVLAGLGSGPRPDRASRQELRDLFLMAGVGDARLAIGRTAWSRATALRSRFPRLLIRLEACLVELGPNTGVRRAIQTALANPDQRCDASEGWGVGIWLDRSLAGSAVQGLCLSVDAGDQPRQLTWKLEIHATAALARSLAAAEDTPWRRVAGEDRWYVVELLTSSGDRVLRKADFTDALAQARIALREVHALAPGRSWHSKGSGEPPHAPRLRIPELRIGIRAFNAVSRSLFQTMSEVLVRLVGRNDTGRRCYQWSGGGLLTGPDALGGVRLRASIEPDLSAFTFAFEGALGPPTGRFDEALGQWPLDGAAPGIVGQAIRFPLQTETWNHPQLVNAVVTVLRAALGVTR